MDTQTLKAQLDRHLDALTDELARGESGGLLAHLKSHARFRTYSPMNRFLILMQRRETAQVLALSVWRSLGMTLKEGAAPIYILAPMFGSARSAAPSDPADDDPHAPINALGTKKTVNAGPTKRRAGGQPTSYKTVAVYAAEDINEREIINATPAPLMTVSEESLGRLIDACPYNIEWDDQIGVRVDGPTIRLPKGQHAQAVDVMNILLGWALHDLDDSNPNSTRDDETAQVEATMSAYAVAEVLGLSCVTFTAQRLSLMWGGKPRKLKNALRRIDSSVQRLLGVLAPQEIELTEAAA